MANGTVYGYVKAERVDDLCPSCWRPSLVHTVLRFLREDGVSEHDRGIRCVHCGPMTGTASGDRS